MEHGAALARSLARSVGEPAVGTVNEQQESTSGKRRKKTREERGYRHLLDSDKWTEISISEWNHHWLAASFSRAQPNCVMATGSSQCVRSLSVCNTLFLSLSLSLSLCLGHTSTCRVAD